MRHFLGCPPVIATSAIARPFTCAELARRQRAMLAAHIEKMADAVELAERGDRARIAIVRWRRHDRIAILTIGDTVPRVRIEYRRAYLGNGPIGRGRSFTRWRPAVTGATIDHTQRPIDARRRRAACASAGIAHGPRATLRVGLN